MAYDSENIFAKILRQEMPCHKLFEDEYTLSFMDLMPRSTGHALVVPKSPYRNLLDCEPDSLSQVIKVVQKVANAQMEVFRADGISIQQFNESAGGQVVFHLHFHCIPRFKDVPLKAPHDQMADGRLLAEQAKLLANILN